MVYSIKKLQEMSMGEFRSLERVRNDFYDGPPLESGGTSIKGKGAAPGIKDLYKMGMFLEGQKVLDYGAGKYARNADYLRDLGFTVYAYDPFNGSSVDGYEYGKVSNKLPNEKFDVAFTSFVLNVVPLYIEKDIVKECESMADKCLHITRNKDIFDKVQNALERVDKVILKYFRDVYKGNDPLNVQEQYDLCCFGVQTSRGFQRIPTTETLGYNLIKDTSGYKVYV